MEIATQADGGVGEVEFCLSGAEAGVGDGAQFAEAGGGGCGGVRGPEGGGLSKLCKMCGSVQVACDQV